MKHFRTSQLGNERWRELPIIYFEGKPLESIHIDLTQKKQTIIGFGGAFTEASAYNLRRVDSSVRQEALNAYFDPENGLGYRLGRVSIHGCDFSLGSYLYIDDFDDSLDSFDKDRVHSIIL